MRSRVLQTLSSAAAAEDRASGVGAAATASASGQENAHLSVTAIALHLVTQDLWSFLEDGSHLRYQSDGQLLTTKLSAAFGTVTSLDVWRDAVVAGTAEGKLALINKNNKVEKVVEAHQGAILGVKWAGDGTLIVTHGEDGTVQSFTRQLAARGKLHQSTMAVSQIAIRRDQVAIASGKQCVVASLNISTNTQTFAWQAHDGFVLSMDWHPFDDLILTCGEDKRYKIWDSYGRHLYSSKLNDTPYTAIAWAPHGRFFAAAAYGFLQICNQEGYCEEGQSVSCGGIRQISWSSDGMVLTTSDASDTVILHEVIGLASSWENIDVTLDKNAELRIAHLEDDISDDTIHVSERVVAFDMQYSKLVVASTTRIYIYQQNATTKRIATVPSAMIDLLPNARISFLQLAASHFLVGDTERGLQLYQYDGKPLSTLKLPTTSTLQRVEAIRKEAICIGPDVVATTDRLQDQLIYLFDTYNGRLLHEQPYRHHESIRSMAMEQIPTTHLNTLTPPTLAFIDAQQDLYLLPILRGTTTQRSAIKLGANMNSMLWAHDSSLLVGASDQSLTMWLWPSSVAIDADFEGIRITKEVPAIKRASSIVSIRQKSGQCILRNPDGSYVHVAMASVGPLSSTLTSLASAQQWSKCLKLCWFLRDDDLWRVLAIAAIQQGDLQAAEYAYSALQQYVKSGFIRNAQNLSKAEARQAYLALFRGQLTEAEGILVSAGLVYQAIMMLTDVGLWERAIQLAVQHKTHVDTVLYLRKHFLSRSKLKETMSMMQHYGGEIQVDADAVKTKLASEEQARWIDPSKANRIGITL